jgi:peptide/nickel transport system permease protein
LARYILKRLVGLLFTLFMVSVITFSIMHAVPGGPFDELKQPLPAAAKANIMRKYGLDKPLVEQYARYMWAALHFDFGIPFQSPTETVTELIARVWPATLQLAGAVILIAYSLGLLLGIVAAINQNTWIDSAVTVFSTLGFTVPNFVIGIWLILIFSVNLHWLPTGGWGTLQNFIMPTFVMSLSPMSLVARYTRVNMLEAMRADYVRTARAKGLSERTIISRHILKNALIPLITVIGPQILRRGGLPHSRAGEVFRHQRLEP